MGISGAKTFWIGLSDLVYTLKDNRWLVTEYKNQLIAQNFDTTNIIGIPIEDDYGPGTEGVHIEEDDDRYISGHYHPGLGEEVMTGLADGEMPLSRITLGMFYNYYY